jgi:hypothetical protein
VCGYADASCGEVIDGRVGVLTFSMMLSAVVVVGVGGR